MNPEDKNAIDAAAALSAAVDSIAGANVVTTTATTSPAPQAPTKPKPKTGLGPRWSYILTRGFVVASVWAFFAYVFDPLVRMGVIISSQTAVRAKVEIDTFETTFFPRRSISPKRPLRIAISQARTSWSSKNCMVISMASRC